MTSPPRPSVLTTTHVFQILFNSSQLLVAVTKFLKAWNELVAAPRGVNGFHMTHFHGWSNCIRTIPFFVPI